MALLEKPKIEVYNYSDYLSLNLLLLGIDEYYVVFNNEMREEVYMTFLRDECYHCRPKKRDVIPPGIYSSKFNAKYSEKWYFKSDSVNCEISSDEIGQFGVFEMVFPNCTLKTLVPPTNIYLPIITVALVYLLVATFIVGIVIVYNKVKKKKIKNDSCSTVSKPRIKSLDTFRGISIFLMLLVNYETGYHFLEHAVWNGLTIADIIFPWFLWIMGVCIPISIQSALKKGDRHIFLHILKRAAKLFMLGIFCNGIDVYLNGTNWEQSITNLRIFGILQRLGLCYLLVASVCLAFMKKDVSENHGILQDILVMLPQWIFALILASIHIGVTFGLKVPYCPVRGYLGAGGLLSEESNRTAYGYLINCTGGSVGYVDRAILGERFMYQSGTFRKIYEANLPMDPDGIMGTCNAVLQVVIGVQAGVTFLMYKNHISRVVRWILWGVVTGIFGGALCGFTRDRGLIPVNQILWSLSYVLVTSSFAFFAYSILYLIIDGNKKIWSGKPFLFAGMNPIIIYVGQELTTMRFPFEWGILQPNLHFQMLSQAVWGTTCWILVAYWLYKKKYFLCL